MKDSNPLKTPLILLSLIFAVFLIFGIFLTNQDVASYCINISVNIFSGIITLLVIDLYVRRQELTIAEKREKIAWNILKHIMYRHFTVLFNIFKATTQAKGGIFTTDQLQNFFSQEYIDTIRHLNANLKAQIFPEANWIDYLRSEFAEFNSRYDSLLNRYSSIMQPDLVEVLEDIKNSTFHQHMTQLLPLIAAVNLNSAHNTPDNMFGQMLSEDTVQTYLINIKKLLSLASKIEIMQTFFQIDEARWKNNMAPLIGSSRV